MPLKLVIGLILILAPLFALQYHRVNRLSNAERQRMEANLREGVRQLTETFDRELTAAYIYFFHQLSGQSDPRSRIGEVLADWAAEDSVQAGIIGQVFLTDPENPDQVFSYRPLQDVWEAEPWPEDLAPLRSSRGPQAHDHGQRQRARPLEPDCGALVIPVHGFGRRSSPGSRRHHAPQRVIIQLDRRFLKEEYFPALCSRHINPRGKQDYLVAVLGSEPRREVIYQTPGDYSLQQFDMTASLFRIGSLPDVNHLLPESLAETFRQRGARRRIGHQAFLAAAGEDPGNLWQIAVAHHSGSLDAAIRSFHFHNMALNGVVLLILGSGIALVLLSAHRARALANRQMEFVAGISHEILTPLAGIRSAAQNLADGLVKEPEKVKTYGTMIENEGGRLADLVEKALEFAGIGTARDQYHFRTVDFKQVVTRGLGACHSLLEDKGFRVDLDLADDLPPLRADAAALERVLINLVTNAVKYAAVDPRIEIRTARGEDGSLRLDVVDHGPGIDAVDLPHLWEPFYRGERARSSQIQGSGLGLCLVENIVRAHGGKVFIAETGPEGTVASVTLPTDGNREVG